MILIILSFLFIWACVDGIPLLANFLREKFPQKKW